MIIRSDTNFTGFDSKTTKTALKNLNKEVKTAVKKFKATPSEDSLQELKTSLSNIKNKTAKIKTDIKDALPEGKKSGYIQWLGKRIKKITDSNLFEKKAIDTNTLPYLLVIGNACKEAVGTAFHTVQALTNEDLPEDKRKFVGMYDLGVGALSTTLSLVLGIIMVQKQSPLIKKLIGGQDASELSGYAKAFSGITFILPVALQTLLIKRVMAPAIATPFAGDLKKKMEEEGYNTNSKGLFETFIPPYNNVALSATSLNDSNTTRDNEKR